MRRGLTMLVLAASLWATGAAVADDDECRVPMSDWQPRLAVQRMAEQQGWVVRRIRIDDGCYQIDGHDASGRPVDAIVDPATLNIISLDHEDDEGGEADAAHGAAPENAIPIPGGGPGKSED